MRKHSPPSHCDPHMSDSASARQSLKHSSPRQITKSQTWTPNLRFPLSHPISIIHWSYHKHFPPHCSPVKLSLISPVSRTESVKMAAIAQALSVSSSLVLQSSFTSASKTASRVSAVSNGSRLSMSRADSSWLPGEPRPSYLDGSAPA